MIKKAVLPVAGFGTRFLPASKATPKEMLPIIDKPLVQYAVEEAIDSGVNEIIFITSPEKHSIKKHFKIIRQLFKVIKQHFRIINKTLQKHLYQFQTFIKVKKNLFWLFLYYEQI